VADQLRGFGHTVELVEIETRGDTEQSRAIEELGTRGVFTKEIQRALLAGQVDIGVHSLKDLPTEAVPGLLLAAVPPRESFADVLVRSEKQGARGEGREGFNVTGMLPKGARVGTGSLRRQAQLRYLRPDLVVSEVRGNVDTRLRKLDEGQFDAIVLAEAGLRRLGLEARISNVFPPEMMLPAVGQGALGIECRADDATTQAAVALLEDFDTRAAVTAERTLLESLRGGCLAPIGALARSVAVELRLSAVVLSPDGSRRIAANDVADFEEAEALGHSVAKMLLAQGAEDLIAGSRKGA
jgi:hydroxymethylbilane synthase